jgi:hypothetical protein
MTIESITKSLLDILGQILRSELDSAVNSIELLVLEDQLPRVTGKGCKGNSSLYPLGRERGQLAADMIPHLNRALSMLHGCPSSSVPPYSAVEEIAAALGIWTFKPPLSF